jgi:hypothetical protein
MSRASRHGSPHFEPIIGLAAGGPRGSKTRAAVRQPAHVRG